MLAVYWSAAINTSRTGLSEARKGVLGSEVANGECRYTPNTRRSRDRFLGIMKFRY
jgi:hypothetical protein